MSTPRKRTRRAPEKPPAPGRDEKGRWTGPHATSFKSGAEWTGNPGGVPKGAQLSRAALRALAREVRKQRGGEGLTRTEADELVDNMLKIAKKSGVKTATPAVAAFKALGELTEGLKIKHEGGEEMGSLGQLPNAQLFAVRAELLRRRREEDGDTGQ